MLNSIEMNKEMQERYAILPDVIKTAINSADVEQHLRDLSKEYKLHLDQWQTLGNEVLLALLGFEPVLNLQKNIYNQVGVSQERAAQLAEAISQQIFEPIRQELERELDHPDAKTEEVSGVDEVRNQMLSQNEKVLDAAGVTAQQATPTPAAEPAPSAVIPATPPPPPVTQKVDRAPISEFYQSQQSSEERKIAHEDPYREPPL